MSGSIISQPTILGSLSGGSYTIVWSGAAPAGSLALQASNDYELFPSGLVKNPGTWLTLPVSDDTGSVVTSLQIGRAHV